MKVKVFSPGKSGKIEFTQKELETLLNEVYREGYSDGKNSHNWGYPYITCTYGTDTNSSSIHYKNNDNITISANDLKNHEYSISDAISKTISNSSI